MDDRDINQAIYLVASLIWIIIVIYLIVFTIKIDLILVILILIPLIAFYINFIQDNTYIETNNIYTKGGIMVSVVILIFSYIVRDYGSNEIFRCFFHKIMYIIIFFFVIGLIDLWTEDKYRVYQVRISSICNTYSLSLLLIGLYIFVRGVCNGEIDATMTEIGVKDNNCHTQI